MPVSVRYLVHTLLLYTAVALGAAQAQLPLTVVNFGGANGKAQNQAFIQPFAREQGVATTSAEYNGDLAAIRAQVQTAEVRWDVVEVESVDLQNGCDEGLFELFDRNNLPHAGMLLPGTIKDCGVGAFVWSTVLAYNSKRLRDAPRSWADFWDVQRFPGKRGLRKGARYNLEIALMSDGVRRRDVYHLLTTEAGVERAFKRLEQLKPHIVWWESGAQPVQRLASGDVSLSSAYNGRIAAAQSEGQDGLQIGWNDAIYELDYWAVVKGSARARQARDFIRYATSEEPQLAFSRAIPYGPTHINAILRYDSGRARASADSSHLVDLSLVPSELPSAPGNLRRSLALDAKFWIQRGATLERMFQQRML
ncbi:ABC transporter substrate-binding protein [Curvibacter sp. APW13]|uniref:ABC transporter substrate-binding protein n=1 Tax=Curvibacter sp. APW13 TaxID=3077236 RepID=UPI0028DE43A0|nr:ABC transporter substrate-binding protein [Curvibacter sp. APW13]MDT8991281.1 ABC transporter substrate-binding protein [Curvibacter sp. APW13]